MLPLAISSGDCSYSEWILREKLKEILSNHLICTMVGYENILETVYVSKTIQGFF